VSFEQIAAPDRTAPVKYLPCKPVRVLTPDEELLIVAYYVHARPTHRDCVRQLKQEIPGLSAKLLRKCLYAHGIGTSVHDSREQEPPRDEGSHPKTVEKIVRAERTVGSGAERSSSKRSNLSSKRRTLLNVDQRLALSALLEAGPLATGVKEIDCWRVEDVQSLINAQFGLSISLSGAYSLLRELGFRSVNVARRIPNQPDVTARTPSTRRTWLRTISSEPFRRTGG
jgi:transposase